MATEVGSLYYDLNIDGKKLKSQLDDADKSVKSFSSKLNDHWQSSVNASKKMLLGVTAVAGATVAFGVASVKAFNESQVALTQLDAVLKSTGKAAGVTREEAIKLSRQIQRQTSLSDEAALAVENMALTFTAIHKDIFPKTTMAAIDMATAMNHGLKPSAEQSADAMKLLGKALQDPDAGLGALHRVGVNTEELKKKFVGLTSVSEKQKLILQELGTEFGGSAAAQAKTFGGRIDQMKNAFNDLQEQIGEVIVKALGPLADKFGNLMERINKAGGLLKFLQGYWERNKDKIVAIAGAIGGSLVPAIVALGLAFGKMLLALSPWMVLGAAVALIILHWDDITRIFGASVHWITDKLQKFKEKLIDIKDNVFGFFKDRLNDIKDAFMVVVDWVDKHRKALEHLADFILLVMGPRLVQLGVRAGITAAQMVASAATSAAGWVAGAAASSASWTIHFAIMSVKAIATAVVHSIQAAIAGAAWVAQSALAGAAWVANFLMMEARAVATAIVFVAQAAIAGYAWVVALGPVGWVTLAVIAGTALIIANWDRVKKFIAKIPGEISKFFNNAYHLLFDVGKWIIWGLKDGMLSVINSIKDAAGNVADAVKDKVKGVLGINSPSKVFQAYGRNVSEGFAKGIADSSHLALGAMSDLSNNVISPQLNVSGTAGGATPQNTTHRYGDTVVNIGQVNNQQNEDWVLRRVNRNQQLEKFGLSPVGG